MKAVIAEAEKNEDFANKLEEILLNDSVEKKVSKEKTLNDIIGRRPSNRRDPAVFNPIDFVASGDDFLISKLEELTDKQLKDIIADYGMDTSKLAMKWKDRNRTINFIVDTAKRRASKGDVFRDNINTDDV